MKKTLGIFLAEIMALSFTFVKAEDAGMNMTLYPGWNVVSTPQILSSISFSNQGNDLSFSELVNGKWVSVSATAANIKPLHGYMVYNSNSSNVTLSLTYKTNVSPTEAVLQKNLNYGWDLLGITTTNSPFNNIGSAAAMSVDFTNNGTTNLKNKVNTKYNWNSTSSSINNPELGEAYGIFINQQNAVYGGVNNGGSSEGQGEGGGTQGGDGKYTVTWLDQDGLELEKDENVQAGTVPQYDGIIPPHYIDYDHKFSQIFSGWKPAVGPITSDTTYSAQYTNLFQDNNKRLNILLIGYGGDYWEGKYLVADTVILASWNLNNNKVDLISLPFIKPYATKPNDLAYSAKNMASNALGLDIQHYATINFKTFKKAIDILGGIDLYIDETINDEYFPNDVKFVDDNIEFYRNTLWGYNPLNISAGPQHLDGETTLQYVRSINTTSDSDRSYRQQKVIKAIKDKVSVEGFNISQLYRLYRLYESEIETDINLSDATWIVANLNKIQEISSFESVSSNGTLVGDYIYLKGVLDDIDSDVILNGFTIEGTSASWKTFSSQSAGNITQFNLFVGFDNYSGQIGCQMDSDGSVQCRTSKYNLSNIEVKAGESINIGGTITAGPLINYNKNDSYNLIIYGKYKDDTPITLTVNLTIYHECDPNSSDYDRCFYNECSTQNGFYSEELQNAYDWAHKNGITTISNIDDTRMCTLITKVELAEILVDYAKYNMNKVPDTSVICSFSDTSSLQGKQATAVKEACQLGIMGIGESAFNPNSTVSRADVGTYLSRLLWGNEYEGGNPYWSNHLIALKNAGIITNISDAQNARESKGYIWLYLQRIDGLENPYQCDDPMTKLICGADPENALCPEACRPEVEPEDENNEEATSTKFGDLKITATANSISNRKVIIGGTSNMDTIKFNPSEEITLSSITLERYGYSNRDQIDSIRLEDENGNMITDVKELNTKDKVSLNFKNNRKNIDDDFSAVIVVSTNDLGSNNGSTISFKVVDVDSTAENLDMTSYTSYIYDLVSYQGSTITISSNVDSLKEYNFVAGDYYEIAKFKVKTSQSNIIVKGFNLSRPDTVDVDITDVIDNLKVLIDDEDVKAKFNVNKYDEIVISFDDVEIAAKDTAIVVVTASFDDEFEDYEDNFNQEFYFELKSENFSAVDKKTAARLSFSENSYILPSYVFNKDKIKLTNTKLGNVDAAEGSIDVVIAEGTISLPEPIKGTFSITASNKGIDKLVMSVVGEEYEGSMQEDEKTFVFDKVEFNESGTIKFKADIKEGVAPGTTFDFLPFSLSNATSLIYVGSKEDAKEDTVGSIAFSRITIFSAKAALENNLTQDAKFPLNEISTKTVFEGTYTAKKGDIILNNFKLEGANPGTNSVSFSLVIDDDEVATEELSGDEPYCAIGSFTDIRVLAGETVSIKVDAEIDASSEGFLGEYELSLGGEDDNGNSIGPSTANTVSIEILSN